MDGVSLRINQRRMKKTFKEMSPFMLAFQKRISTQFVHHGYQFNNVMMEPVLVGSYLVNVHSIDWPSKLIDNVFVQSNGLLL